MDTLKLKEIRESIDVSLELHCLANVERGGKINEVAIEIIGIPHNRCGPGPGQTMLAHIGLDAYGAFSLLTYLKVCLLRMDEPSAKSIEECHKMDWAKMLLENNEGFG